MTTTTKKAYLAPKSQQYAYGTIIGFVAQYQHQ